jgi:hypothetical protein
VAELREGSLPSQDKPFGSGSITIQTQSRHQERFLAEFILNVAERLGMTTTGRVIPNDRLVKTPLMVRELHHERKAVRSNSCICPFALSPVEGLRRVFTQSDEERDLDQTEPLLVFRSH